MGFYTAPSVHRTLAGKLCVHVGVDVKERGTAIDRNGRNRSISPHRRRRISLLSNSQPRHAILRSANTIPLEKRFVVYIFYKDILRVNLKRQQGFSRFMFIV